MDTLNLNSIVNHAEKRRTMVSEVDKWISIYFEGKGYVL